MEPGFSRSTQDYGMVERFTKELKQVGTLPELREFVTRWAPVWNMQGHGKDPSVEEIDTKIRNGFITEEDLACIKLSFEINDKGEIGKKCPHLEQGLCVGMEIRMPWSMSLALMVSTHYGVPPSIGFHQLFCDDPNHFGCF